MSTLVIVESPAKAKTISKFLGRRYCVKASMGHVRDLPKSKFGVDVDNGFIPHYITVRGQGKILQELRTAARKADNILLATDPDREGEAISWHLAESLKLDKDAAQRIVFHEITKEAIRKAIKQPRPLDTNLINAQQARRVLDRVVGYKLSPFLWAKVKPGLSAGRVQSPALRLICDRENEIKAFVSEEYWTIEAALAKNVKDISFTAKLLQCGRVKCKISNQQQCASCASELHKAHYTVKNVTRSERQRKPPAPFTTSTLQQEAARRLSFTARRTMSVAQQLYEGLDLGQAGTVGLITYLRTDATTVSSMAQSEAQQYIDQNYGPELRPVKPPKYKTPVGAQAAHEAIRPTSVWRTPASVKQYLSRDQHLLYKLIWTRFLASQMRPAIFDTVVVDIIATSSETTNEYLLRANGSTMRFAGFMSIYNDQNDDENASEDERTTTLPELESGAQLVLKDLQQLQHFTQPPPRYTEAMLVKSLEELGLGRPSTYVAIIETLSRRGYVIKENKRFVPTELGMVTVDLLREHFPDVVDVEFTAHMENKLDKVEEGDVDWIQMMQEFYEPFNDSLTKAHASASEVQIKEEVTDEVCEQCGRNMVVKWGRFGKFLACPGYPDCRNTRPILTTIGVKCPKCGADIVARRSKRGRPFYGCSSYPECDFTSWQRPVNQPCPQCGSYMVERNSRKSGLEWVCSVKECQHVQPAVETVET